MGTSLRGRRGVSSTPPLPLVATHPPLPNRARPSCCLGGAAGSAALAAVPPLPTAAAKQQLTAASACASLEVPQHKEVEYIHNEDPKIQNWLSVMMNDIT